MEVSALREFWIGMGWAQIQHPWDLWMISLGILSLNPSEQNAISNMTLTVMAPVLSCSKILKYFG